MKQLSRMLAAALPLLALHAQGASAQTMSATVRYRTVPGYQNIYLTSFPYARAFQDIADSSLPGNHCVDNVLLGDGIINADDVICTVWGAGDPAQRVGSFSIARFNEASCQFEYRLATFSWFGILFAGEAWDFEPGVGYWITLSASRGGVQDFTMTYVDDCVPAYPGRMIRPPVPDCVPRLVMLHVPYNSALRTANEILCGVEGLDWIDADGDGAPDTCPNGIYDGLRSIAVLTYDNEPGGGAATPDNQFSYRAVAYSFFGHRFTGVNFALREGEAYVASTASNQQPTTWDPATGPCN